MIIKGDHINLRKLKRSDAESVYKYAKDKEISKFTEVPHPYTLEHAKRFISNTHQKMKNRSDYELGIELKETKEIIGMMSLMKVDYNNMNAEIGYWLGKTYWRKGYTIEALKLLIEFGFKELKLKRIWARVMAPNTASADLLRKAGFSYEGRLIKAIYRDNQFYDELRFGLVRDER